MYPGPGPGGMQWAGGGIDRRSMAHDFATSNSLVYRHATGACDVTESRPALCNTYVDNFTVT